MSTTTPLDRIDLGGVTITPISGGAFKLDGGAMFGIIPKPLWSRNCPADELNRISLACNCLLVEWSGPSSRRAILEVGHGPKYAEKEQKMFAIDPARWLRPALLAAAVDPAEINDVVLTHLHFDHAGGLTWDAGDGLRPTFPNATVHVQRREFEDARENFGIMTMTYREDNFRPIDESSAWRLLDGPGLILDGLRALASPGHTRGHQSILIEGRNRAALFPGDVLPTRHHVGAPYNMGYDLFPLENRQSKLHLLGLAADRHWLLVLDHDPQSPVLRVLRDGSAFRLEPPE